ncbi:hypothetical protein [Kineococcus sp. SYSU DK001]|uniref:hypothetical protein n=1 Tax=Kineococcus sp. SYSU DK001 TaxID=3383122 RepID=UPI003D7DDB5A
MTGSGDAGSAGGGCLGIIVIALVFLALVGACGGGGSSSSGAEYDPAVCERIAGDRAVARAALQISDDWDGFSDAVDDLNEQADSYGCGYESASEVAGY